ncbi:hypothetical protein EDC04DRAFT_2715239 [Pisolithus marmoratus]|nr:hypothetical protein EDC04DRAFT_2715239 [Pisolithus marmoratus]
MLIRLSVTFLLGLGPWFACSSMTDCFRPLRSQGRVPTYRRIDDLIYDLLFVGKFTSTKNKFLKLPGLLKLLARSAIERSLIPSEIG